jgi:serine protease Do/serine protease DegQ
MNPPKLSLLSLCAALFGALAATAAPAAKPMVTPVSASPAIMIAGQPVTSLAPIIKLAGPAVVNIASRGTQQMQANPFYDDPFFRRFFGVPQPREREVQSQGSGVIVDAKKGYIVTNHHVVEGATEIRVTLQDERSFTATLVGSDERTDLAVIKIDAGNLKSLPLADSDQLEVGDFVIAIGNPFGLDHTVTSGIVSGLGRRGLNAENYEDFIQTDAAINPGNSGGALIDLRGNLVGINAAIISRSGGNMGIGFAIPVNMVRSVMGQLIEHGSVERGVLGILGGDLSPEVAETLGVKGGGGALVNQVTAGGGAEKAGVQAGDVVVAVDGKAVASMGELRNRVGLMRKGQKVKLDVIRDGKALALTATIMGAESLAVTDGAVHPKLAGASFGEIDERSPFYGRLKGAMVVAVDPGSNAATRARLEPGDVIVAVNRRPVVGVADLAKAMQSIDANAAFLLELRRGNMRMVFSVQ